MENFEDNLFFIQMSASEKPQFVERRNRQWVTAGKDNKLFDELIDLSLSASSTHTSILQTKIDLINGMELIVNGADHFDISDLFLKTSSDFEVVGACAIEVLKNRNVLTYNHIPIQNLRFSKADERNKIEGMFYSRDWSNLRQNPEIFIPFYDEKSSEKRQVLLIRKYWPGSPYQILPSYFPALNWINIDSHISKFHLSSLEIGFNPGMIISFNDGKPDEKTKKEIVRRLEEKYGGSHNASRVMVMFNKNAETAAQFQQLESSAHHEMFITLNDMVLQQILTAHRISPLLAGVQTPGKLGSTNEYTDSLKIYMNNVIYPQQKLLISAFNNLLKQGGISIDINNDDSIVYNFTENLLKDILTVDELRKMAGFNIKIEKND